jgi:hypothetical protein
LRLALLASAAAQATSHAAVVRFVDATREAGIEYRNVCGAPLGSKGWLSEAMGAGAAWLDADGDGNLDLYFVNGSSHERGPLAGAPNLLLRGDGRGRFTDATAAAGVGHRGWGYGVAVGDVDNDGDPDLYVTNFGPNVLYRNRGDGTFEDVTQQAGVAGADEWSTSAAFFDADGDADLDLYVANYMECDPARVPRRGAPGSDCIFKGIPVACGPLGQVPLQDRYYRNRGDGTFVEATSEAGLELRTPRFALGVVTGDYDNDGDADVYVANDSVQNSLWRNAGDGTFTDVGVASLAALNADGATQAGMGTDFGDFDGDGWLDLVVTNFSHDVNTVYRGVEGRYFADESLSRGLGLTFLFLSWGTGFHDFDHDGDLDLFIANGHVYPEVDEHEIGTRFRQVNHLFLNAGGEFQEAGAAAGPGMAAARSFRGAAFGDYDNDGDTDVVLTALDDAALLLRDDGDDKGHFLQLLLVGTRSNRDAVGARVTLTAGGRSWIRERKGGGSYLSASSPWLHFGLGQAARVERLEIRWPNGGREVLQDLAADRRLIVRQGEGVSVAPGRGSP